MLRYFYLFVITLLLTLFSVKSFSQNNSFTPTSVSKKEIETVKVGVHISPPFVMGDQKDLTGMAIELWEILDKELGLETTYVVYSTVQELLQNLQDEEIDIAVTNLTITKERARLIAFTHPWFDSGLRVMVSEDQSTGFLQIIKGLQESGYLRIYLWIAGMIIFSSVLLMFYDRHFDEGFPASWRDGLARSSLTGAMDVLWVGTACLYYFISH